MYHTPSSQPCPPYVPATQITPDSIDEISTQENSLFTQESRRISFDQIHQPNPQGTTRNYYDQLFSSDSEDDEFDESSDMSISESEYSFKSPHSPDSSDSDMSISSGEVTNNSIVDTPLQNQHIHNDTNNIPFQASKNGKLYFDNIPSNLEKNTHIDSFNSDMSISTDFDSFLDESSLTTISSQSTGNSVNSQLEELSNLEEWKDGNETWGISSLLSQKEIDNLLGVNEIERPKPTLEKLPNQEIDKIGTFNIRNKYDHDLAAYFMMKEKITFLSLQEPFSNVKEESTTWSTYRTHELESARITCYETPFQVILFDSWKWGGKIISPFNSIHHGRATSIAFEFEKGQKLGIISIYAPTKECSKSLNEDELPTLSKLTTAVNKMIKQLYHQFPGICVMVMGDLQETITTTDADNLGNYRKDYNENGILASLLPTHTSIVRERTVESNYITRHGEVGGRGIDHILFPNSFNNENWIDSTNIDRPAGATYFPSDHSFIFCNIHRNGQNNNEDSATERKFDYRKICNIKLKLHTSDDGKTNLNLDETQYKDCEGFKQQKILYDAIQNATNNSSHLSDHYMNEIEDRIKFLYKELWKEGVIQKTDGKSNKLVIISEDHAAELSFILRKFQTGVKDVLTGLDCFKDIDQNGSAGIRRGRLRQEKGFHFTKSWPIQTKLRYLKVTAKVKLHLLKQILYFCKDYRFKNLMPEQSKDLQSLEKSWIKIFDSSRLQNESKECYHKTVEELFQREKHVRAIQAEKDSKKESNGRCKDSRIKMEDNENKLEHTPENVTKLINFWLHESNCNHAFNTDKENSDKYSFLLSSSENYLNPIKNLDLKHMIAGDLDDARFFYTKIQESINILTNFSSKISKAQFWFKHSTLSFLLDTNKIAQFSNKLMQKNKNAPETHSEIWDPTTQAMRKCKNEYEELIATSEHHNRWMANSQAKEVCAFAKLRVEGKLGIRGIDLHPDRIIGEKDIPDLVHNGEKLSKDMKKQFVAAHGEHTANLFRPPDEDRKELFYPFYLMDMKGTMNEGDNFEKNYMKAISSIPTKARYSGFHMAVVGRFGERWQKALSHIIKLILLLRYIPTDLKRMARFPIPKPGKINEYRPISLCHDIYCFVNGICTKYTSEGIEKANFLHDGIVAYRPGKGCHSLVTVEQCFREDCREHNLPAAQIDEDEEKFFDRIPVEILLTAMRVNGFPEQGFLEIKASGMGAKYVDIITKKGIAYAKFICGLEQGNPDSPTVANLVIKLKHDVWDYISNKASAIFARNKAKTQGKYTFNTIDKQDGPITICKIGYCDDNSKYCFIENEEDLNFLVKYYLQLAGDLSMVTKIGRKGSKSEIQFFNVSAEFALKIKKSFSSAWSFIHDAPISEEVPIKICLKESEIKKFMEISDYENLDQEEQLKWDSILFPKAHRHLGLTGTLSGMTNETCSKTLYKMRERIKNLKIPNMQEEAQVKCFNMLCSTIHSFVPLQAGYGAGELEKVDKEVINLIKRSRGLSKTDAKHSFFLPLNLGGMGFKSIQDVDLISTARELEIISNGNSIDSEIFRTRLAAIPKYEDDEIEFCCNHAWRAIKKLARFGIYFRDKSEHVINAIFSRIEQLPRYQGIGSGNFLNGNKPFLGNGRDKNLEIMFGGTVHRILHLLQSVNWNISEFRSIHPKKSPIDIRKLIQFRQEACISHFNELTSLFSYWEWINIDGQNSIPSKNSEWNFVNISQMIKEKFPQTYWQLSNDHVLKEVKTILNVDLFSPNAKEKYSILGKRILNSSSPIFVATDGAHENHAFKISSQQKISGGTKKNTSASFVLCIADMESEIDGDSNNNFKAWEDKPSIPLLCRVSSLPNQFGTDTTDVAHGEALAIAMQEWTLPHRIPRILITDSESVRNVNLNLRKRDNNEIDRRLVRTMLGGVSKFITSELLSYLNKESFQIVENESNSRNSSQMQRTITTLRHRMKLMERIAEHWTQTVEESEKTENRKYGIWRKDYHDSHNDRIFFKINSHQLNRNGTEIKAEPRYPMLTPNFCFLHMNHHADATADLGKIFQKDEKGIRCLQFSRPPSILRYHFTWGGRIVDRHISEFVREKINLERLFRLKTKATQGLAWRFIDHVSVGWNKINLHKGWKRALMGLSRTHTRSMYKSEIYRNGCAKEFESQCLCENGAQTYMIPPKKNSIIAKYSKCMWCPDHLTKPSPHGNRKHAMLDCTHPDLQNFRRKMANLIELKLKNLFVNLRTATNEEQMQNLFKTIEKECVFLQKSTLGRCKKANYVEKFSYIHINELEKKYNISNLMEGCSIYGTLFSELLGVIPQKTATNIQDRDLGILDAFWLGLIPDSINNIILKGINKNNLLRFTPDTTTCIATAKDLFQAWLEIQDLIMAKAIGLHRIIGQISKAKEKRFRKIEKLNNASQSSIAKEFVETNQTSSTDTIQLNDKKNIHKKPKLAEDTTSLPSTPSKSKTKPLTFCKGITCNQRNS